MQNVKKTANIPQTLLFLREQFSRKTVWILCRAAVTVTEPCSQNTRIIFKPRAEIVEGSKKPQIKIGSFCTFLTYLKYPIAHFTKSTEFPQTVPKRSPPCGNS